MIVGRFQRETARAETVLVPKWVVYKHSIDNQLSRGPVNDKSGDHSGRNLGGTAQLASYWG